MALPLVLALVGAGVVAYALSREDPRPPAGTNVAEDMSEGPLRVVFADFAEGAQIIREHHLTDDEARDLAELPRLGQVDAAPGSDYLSIEWWDADVGAPRVTVVDPRSDEEVEIAGFAHEPIWHPEGRLLAYSEPLDPNRCTQDDCPGDGRVLVFDPATGESQVLLEGGPWFPRFWVGDRLLYQDEDDATIVHLEGLDGDRATLDVWAMGARSASPDGRWLFVSWEEETALYPLGADGNAAGDPLEVEGVPPAGLRTAAWSHDSSLLAGAPGSRSPELLLIDPDDPEPRVLAELEGSVTRLAWAPTNDAVLVTISTDRFQTLLCSVSEDAGDEGCREVFDWTTGISPLRVEGSA